MYFCINVIPNSMKNSQILTISLLLFVTSAAFAIPNDSLAIERSKGKKYVIHKVEPQETLYSLLKRYQCSPADVLAANPTLKAESTIYPNQLLRFPINPKENQSKSGESATENEGKKSKKLYHEVEKGETLFAICQKYNLEVSDVKAWNSLSDNTIAIGQKLIIDSTYKAIGPAADEVVVATKPKKVVKTPVAEKTPANDYVPNAPTGKRISESGIAAIIETNSNSPRLLALHRFAPVGSMMMVRNAANGSSVMVKVIGKLPDTGNNQDVLIRLSPAAFQRLNARESRIRANIEYVLSPR